MKWVGLTGGIASGKSEASKILVELGVPVIDADGVANSALKKGTEPYQKIVHHFGRRVCTIAGEIDRQRLGQIVFNNQQERLRLEEFVHPFVQQEVRRQRDKLARQGHSWAVYDVPLLFEKQLQQQFDDTVLIDCAPTLQVRRLMQRNGLTKADAQLRIDSQLPLAEKRKMVNQVIENNGSLAELRTAVSEWKRSIDAKYSGPKS